MTRRQKRDRATIQPMNVARSRFWRGPRLKKVGPAAFQFCPVILCTRCTAITSEKKRSAPIIKVRNSGKKKPCHVFEKPPTLVNLIYAVDIVHPKNRSLLKVQRLCLKTTLDDLVTFCNHNEHFLAICFSISVHGVSFFRTIGDAALSNFLPKQCGVYNSGSTVVHVF